ncbi:MAG: hypothetical protein C0621_04800 [Desulfuromonas sp.]|nr:MAG: hypothetical protein C0621_04800 [Desulfuromonas sp.]
MITILIFAVIVAAIIACLVFFLRGNKTKYRPYAFGAIVLVGLSAGYFSMSKHPVYVEIINIITNNQEIIEQIGSPVKTGLSMKATYNDTFGRFKFPINGPKGHGTVSVYAEKENGYWVFRTFNVDFGSKILDLKAVPNHQINADGK